MSQALAEFRAPVGQEALRLRMAAMHGRDDALLEAGRFPRLLRQANDAEIADVRKIGEDDYEITASPKAPCLRRAGSSGRAEEPAVELRPAPEAIEAGVPAERWAVRVARTECGPGSASAGAHAGTLRPGEIPLIGVVQVETPAEVVVALGAGRPGRGGRTGPSQEGGAADGAA